MSKIASVKAIPISVDLKHKYWNAHGSTGTWTMILVEIRTNDGILGYGKIHNAPMKRICEWVQRLGEIIRGMDATAHVAVWEKLFSLMSPRPGGIRGRDGLPSPLPLAHGEREIVRFTARNFITSGAIRYIQFDGTRHGGFTESLRIAALAEQFGVWIAPHHAPEIHSHLIAAYPRFGFCVESHGDRERDPIFYGLYSERAQIRDGWVHMNDKPGFGIEIDQNFLARYRV